MTRRVDGRRIDHQESHGLVQPWERQAVIHEQWQGLVDSHSYEHGEDEENDHNIQYREVTTSMATDRRNG